MSFEDDAEEPVEDDAEEPGLDVHFHNTLDVPVTVAWKHLMDGKEVPVDTVAPGEKLFQGTFRDHEFVVREAGKPEAFAHLCDADGSRVRLMVDDDDGEGGGGAPPSRALAGPPPPKRVAAAQGASDSALARLHAPVLAVLCRVACIA